MTTINSAPEAALTQLGFTEIEAKLYCELARTGSATGYRLAKAIGKAPTNTYQALESLLQKGAVVVDESEAKAWRAVPSTELIAALKAGFESRSTAAGLALATLRGPAPDARLYALKSREAVFAKARAMIAGAREAVLFDLFPDPFAELRAPLEAAAAQGLVVAGLVYDDVATSIRATITGSAGGLAGRWPGLQVTLAVDGREHLVALLSPDGRQVLQGLWSDSPYLACLQHNALAAEIRLSGFERAGHADPFADISLLALRPSGLNDLLGDSQ
jgi:sugar-specific transcriptional regulator TrmB